MTDFTGKELNIGDEVVFIYSNLNGGRRLMKGKIEKFERGCAYIEGMHYCCYDDDPSEVSHFDRVVKVKSGSIYKI